MMARIAAIRIGGDGNFRDRKDVGRFGQEEVCVCVCVKSSDSDRVVVEFVEKVGAAVSIAVKVINDGVGGGRWTMSVWFLLCAC